LDFCNLRLLKTFFFCKRPLTSFCNLWSRFTKPSTSPMTEKKSSAFNAFVKFLKTIDKVGSTTTSKILDIGEVSYYEKMKINIDFIIKETCKNYEITKIELLTKRTLNDRTEARAICIYIANKHLNLSPAEIQPHFKTSLSQISRGIKKIRELEKHIPQHKKTLEKLSQIESICLKFFDGGEIKSDPQSEQENG
jgi:hypothetical protein